MKLKRAQKKAGRRAVLVHWVDSAGADGWTMDGDGPTGAMDIWSVGWLIRETDEALVVACSASAANGGDPQSMAPVAIPRRAVLRWSYLDGGR